MDNELFRLQDKLFHLNGAILTRQMQAQGFDVLKHGGGEEAHFNRAALRQLREKRDVTELRIRNFISL